MPAAAYVCVRTTGLVAATIVSVVAFVALILAANQTWPAWTLFAAAVLAAAMPEGKVSLIVTVTPDLAKKAPAGQLVKHLAPIVGGGGGGRVTGRGGETADRAEQE